MTQEGATHLLAALGAGENRKGAVHKNTVTANRRPQQRDVSKNSVKLASFAGKNAGVVRRPFAVFDIDGTLIRWQLYHATTDALAAQGYLTPKDYQQIRRARMTWKKREHIDAFRSYESQVIQAFEKIIQTITVKQFESAVDIVIKEYKDQVYTYSRQLIKELKAKNYVLLAISGSQTELVSRIAAYYGFDDYIGTDYIKHHGRFTGIKNFQANKELALQALIDKHSLGVNGSLGVGDSESDIAMLKMVDQPIAFNPSKGLFDEALKRKWKIVVERKNVVYQFEHHSKGYVLK